MPNSWRWSAGPTPLSNEGHQYDRKQSIISIARFVWCQEWYTNRIWLKNQFQTWASTVGQNWGCQPTKWPDMIWLMRSFIDYSNRQLLIRHNMNNKMNWLFFMRIPPCPLALYRLCLFSEVSHQRHSCSCCRSESRKSIFLVGKTDDWQNIFIAVWILVFNCWCRGEHYNNNNNLLHAAAKDHISSARPCQMSSQLRPCIAWTLQYASSSLANGCNPMCWRKNLTSIRFSWFQIQVDLSSASWWWQYMQENSSLGGSQEWCPRRPKDIRRSVRICAVIDYRVQSTFHQRNIRGTPSACSSCM